MIKQTAIYMNDSSVKVTKEEKTILKNYPGLEVLFESNKYPYVLTFNHEKKLTAKKLGLNDKWVIGPVTYIDTPQPVVPGFEIHVEKNQKKTKK